MERLVSKTVANFPSVFRAESGREGALQRKAALQKVSRWWKFKHDLDSSLATTTSSITRVRCNDGRQRVYAKAFRGRGRRRAPWFCALFDDMQSEFHRLRRAGLKIDRSVLRSICLEVLKSSKKGDDGTTMLVPGTTSTTASKITPSFIQRFTDASGLVVRKQTGKLMISDVQTV
jgi:hypothetical protein